MEFHIRAPARWARSMPNRSPAIVAKLTWNNEASNGARHHSANNEIAIKKRNVANKVAAHILMLHCTHFKRISAK